jgi:hypothetical protein
MRLHRGRINVFDVCFLVGLIGIIGVLWFL